MNSTEEILKLHNLQNTSKELSYIVLDKSFRPSSLPQLFSYYIQDYSTFNSKFLVEINFFVINYKKYHNIKVIQLFLKNKS